MYIFTKVKFQSDYLEMGGGLEGGVGYSVEGFNHDETDRSRHNWTEIILAFTFTVTVVLIFIL